MNLWLTRQWRFVLAAFAVLTIAGGYALLRLPVSLFPALEFPRIAVSLEAGDRPADEMVVRVTRPVEEALRAIPGVHDIRSQSSRGSAEISVTFGWGQDMITAALQAESEIARLEPNLPPGFSFLVRRMDPTIFPVLGYSITSEGGSLVALKNFALYDLRPLLAAIDGVAEVSVLGGRDAEFQVVVDPVRLQTHGLSIADVAAVLGSDNLVSASGRLEDRSRLFLTIVDDRLTGLDDIGSVILKSANGTVVKLNDVADIRLSTAQEWTRVTADGKTAVLVNIRQAPEANSLALTDAIKTILQREQPRFPPGLVITPYYDQSDLIRSAASSVRDSILLGTLLAGIVLYIFLRSLRFVMVVAILLPAVLTSTALLLTVLGLSLNIMTLGGMAAAVGLIVDDVVVMLEHISRHLTRKTANVLEAASEMTRPLLGSSMATIIVFTPLAFLDGVTGGFFKSLAITMASALLFSMIYAMGVVPLLAMRLARAEDAARAEHANRWLVWLSEHYASIMARALPYSRRLALGLIALAVLSGGVAASKVASGFMPEMDEGGFVLDYVAPPGLSLTEADRLLLQLEDIIRSVPEVASYSRRTGIQLGGGLTEANEGDLFVRLKPLPRRGIDDVMAEIRGRIEREVPGLEIETIQLMADLIGDLTAVPQPIEVKFYSNDPTAMAAAAELAVTALEGIPGVIEVQPSDRIAGDAIVVTFDRAHLALEGLDPAQVTAQLEALVGGGVTGSVQAGERTINIRVWTPQSLRDRVEAISALQLRAPDGHLLPLQRVARVEVIKGQAQISRENLQPMTAVTARLDGRDMGSAMRDVSSAMQAVSLPAGVRYEFGGLYVQQQKSFADLLTVFVCALVLAGLLLLFVFRDFAQTASIMLVVGLTVAGVLCALVITGTELNIAAMMGLTMVIGIIAELGVFYFAELPDTPIDHSHRIAAGRARLRPIFMSALIAILALAPLALKLGEGAALLAPMAVTIISGLLFGAPLVLLAAPILHSALTRTPSHESIALQ
ncbi:MAG: efflux RND transporter permease subunit [Halioglobus sp.]